MYPIKAWHTWLNTQHEHAQAHGLWMTLLIVCSFGYGPTILYESRQAGCLCVCKRWLVFYIHNACLLSHHNASHALLYNIHIKIKMYDVSPRFQMLVGVFMNLSWIQTLTKASELVPGSLFPRWNSIREGITLWHELTGWSKIRDPVPAKFKHVTNIETCTLLCCD